MFTGCAYPIIEERAKITMFNFLKKLHDRNYMIAKFRIQIYRIILFQRKVHTYCNNKEALTN